MLRLYWGIYLIYQGISQSPPAGCHMMDDERLTAIIREHEGVRLFPYVDTSGKLTIGVGHNLTDNGISSITVDAILAEDISISKRELDKEYPEWCDLTEDRQIVLVSMVFNMGMPTYKKFVKFWAALRAEEYDVAADEMLDSRWRKQVKNRAVELAAMMRRG